MPPLIALFTSVLSILPLGLVPPSHLKPTLATFEAVEDEDRGAIARDDLMIIVRRAAEKAIAPENVPRVTKGEPLLLPTSHRGWKTATLDISPAVLASLARKTGAQRETNMQLHGEYVPRIALLTTSSLKAWTMKGISGDTSTR